MQQDTKVSFPAFFTRGRAKRDKRMLIAQIGITWLNIQHQRGAGGAVMIDIDDTLIDGRECVANGFEHMFKLYDVAFDLFPIHIVTARPDDTRTVVMQLLKKKKYFIPVDRLHMLPRDQYGKDPTYRYVEKFKWQAYRQIGKMHGGVVARFGDKSWDVLHIERLSNSHVEDKDTYLCLDPKLEGTASFKLPGSE